MSTVFPLLVTVMLLSMVNFPYAESASDAADTLQAGVILEAGEIDSNTVAAGAFAVVIHGQGERHPVSGEWERLETARGYIQAVDAETLTLARGQRGGLERIALERIQTLVLAESPFHKGVERMRGVQPDGLPVGQLQSPKGQSDSTQAGYVGALTRIPRRWA